MTTKERYEGVLGWFAGKMPVAESELKYNDPFELIVAVILSAQCTDKRVNMTTPALFERFPDAKAMAAGTVEDIYKTANVVMAVAFHKPAMPVDTHVFRVSNRIGLVNNTKTPLETEKQLVKNIPAEILSTAHHWLILHGRYVCLARKPKCEECGIRQWCRFFQSRR